MTDINFTTDDDNGDAAPQEDRSGEPLIDLIELLFFAYRDFISDPDAILVQYGFGRAHHRVIHFVNRNPGLTVADLLDILKITKQSLGRVLKQLVDSGFIHQVTGPRDRRQRLLYATAEGRALAARLSEPQSRRIRAALAGLDPQARRTVSRFLFATIDPAEQPKVAQLVEKERAIE
jgi:DNA-binding MarR family transcriptional regulator